MKHLLALWVSVLALVAPAHARAGIPYTLHWTIYQDASSCEDARLRSHNGEAFFHVNETPIPTFEIPGAYVENADDSSSNVAEAPFDSVLLRWRENEFFFGIKNSSGDDTCVEASAIVHLVSAPLGLEKPLFKVWRHGTAFSGSTKLDLSLEEINPPLARDIANLEAEIEAEREWLIRNAAKTAALAERLDMLQQLDTELHDLLKRPLDEIAALDLDAILDRYSEVVDDATRAALEELIEDLKQSVIDLENELASLIDHFGDQADAVVDLATADARGEGFDPEDPSGYGLGPAATPWVEVPDVSGVADAFEEGNDPYAAYADAVLATLAGFVQGGEVVARASFTANVRAWRANQAALEKALLERVSVSLTETNAFLKAQNRVTGYVLQFMDASYWYLDTSVPADVRADVDGVLKNQFGPLAEEMKDSLNQWQGLTLNLEETQLVETIRAFAGAVAAVGDVVTPYTETMATLVQATSRVAIGFVPYVGPTLDLCEAVTGKLFCLPGGKELSLEERVFSAVGFGGGALSKAWSGVKNTGVNPGAKAAAQGVLSLGEEFALALQASKMDKYKNILKGWVTTNPINDFEKKAALYLMKDKGHKMLGVGDDAVRKMLKIPEQSQPYLNDGLAPDFLSVTKEAKLVLSEAKGVVSSGGVVDAGHAVQQLKNAMTKLAERNLAGDVERVQLIKSSGAKLKDNFTVKDGYLLNGEGKTVTLPGKSNFFVRVVEI